MTSKTQSSVASHRARKERQGFVRVEVNVRKEDASLVRRAASALSDPSRQAEAREFLRQRFAEPAKVSLKALLASAPLDGIDLDRDRDLGRDVDDGLLAATALTNGLTLVTRNDRDTAGLGATVLNPFKSTGNHPRS